MVWRQELQPPFRSRQKVIINAPLEAVRAFRIDLTRIPEFHPRVFKVDLLSGKTLREPGISPINVICRAASHLHREGYRDCPIAEDHHHLAQDAFGISKILSDYKVKTTFQRMSGQTTKVEISHHLLNDNTES